MKVSALLFVCDKPNKNGRVYPRALANKLVEDFHDRVELSGQVGMPENGKLLLTNISHVVRELKVVETGEDWGLEATIETLPHAPAGKVLAQIMEDEKNRKHYTFRTAGTGTLVQQPDGTCIVGPDFILDSVNLVLTKDAA